MRYAQACYNLVIDNPHKFGYPEQLGCGRDWPAVPVERSDRLYRLTPDIGSAIAWDLAGGDAEYIDCVNGIGPVGTAELRTMAVGPDRDDILAGISYEPAQMWRPSPVNGFYGNVRWLQYIDGRPGRLTAGEPGRVVFSDQDYMNIHLWLYRRPIAPDETDVSAVDLIWLGPEDYDGPVYGIHIPRSRQDTMQTAFAEEGLRRHKGPTLMGRGIDCDEWAVIDEYVEVSAGLRNEAAWWIEAYYDEMRIEQIGDTMRVRWFSRDNEWIYSGDWTDSKGRQVRFGGLPEGRLQISVYGERVDLTMAPILYERDVTVRPQGYFYTNMRMRQISNYRRLALGLDDGATCVVAPEYRQGRYSRPVVTLDAPAAPSDTTKSTVRAVLQRVQEFRWPALTGAASNPIQSQDNQDLIIRDISGRCDARWRGSTMTAECVAAHANTLPTLFGLNQWIRAEASCDDGATYYQQFEGRITPPEKRQSGQDPTKMTLEASGDDTRLREHKTMHAHPSYENWPAYRAYTYILARQNVPEEQRWIEAAATAESYRLPRAEDGGGRLQFDAHQSPCNALDAICDAVNLDWGWDGFEGRYFLRTPPARTAGSYDLEIDQDTMDPDAGDVIYDLRRLKSLEDFATMVHVLAERGSDATAATIARWASIADPTDEYFMADDWWHIEQYEDGGAVSAIAQRLWEARGRLRDFGAAILHDLPQIRPEWDLKLTADVVDVSAGSIYQVDQKRWRDADGWYEQTLDLVLVEEG